MIIYFIHFSRARTISLSGKSHKISQKMRKKDSGLPASTKSRKRYIEPAVPKLNASYFMTHISHEQIIFYNLPRSAYSCKYRIFKLNCSFISRMNLLSCSVGWKKPMRRISRRPSTREHASMWCWTKGKPAIGKSGFGMSKLNGRNRVPWNVFYNKMSRCKVWWTGSYEMPHVTNCGTSCGRRSEG